MSGPFIITVYGDWMVDSDITDDIGWIGTEMTGLTSPPRSGWVYTDGTSWVLDAALLFLPGGDDSEKEEEGG